MPASLGGSVVDQSLLRQAADRGVTICFADLDGADGLWVPEERTVLVNRGLTDAQVAEVIEHELAHVMIDDQHVDLDAGKEVLVGRSPWRSRRRETAVLAAALGLVAVVGGVMYGVNAARGDVKLDQVAPNPSAPGLTAGETADPKPSTSVIRTTLPDGRVVERTVVLTETAQPASASASGSAKPSATATKQPPTASAPSTTAPPTTSTAPPDPPTTDPPASTTPSEVPTTDPPTPAETAGGVGDTGAAPAPTEPAAVADDQVDSSPVDGTTGP